eukprot:CAMPEP_0119112176 /NCGR_PEP_ID=MMETSP1180-20130426/39070_1 /TAXON_ID=3052 ORGANISM="Chlamydomonas cf sp, Strain CCMP681" /NCGR_SAMPLE_ID=MMETSP1180 /ASSEMBLY_ACC=CAM_ASM_000741 /LENGTH=41 /DNA_ID= /DNA_START= /DNA_END= /DNA_ORIENTATION=
MPPQAATVEAISTCHVNVPRYSELRDATPSGAAPPPAIVSA